MLWCSVRRPYNTFAGSSIDHTYRPIHFGEPQSITAIELLRVTTRISRKSFAPLLEIL
jgi:hypothetical protein